MFLFGIETMSDALLDSASDFVSRLLQSLTKNKALCILSGILATALVQSSSATTVMVVGFVNAGMISLQNAVAVIMGANIGTTVTSLLLCIDLPLGAVLTAVGGLLLLGGKETRFHVIGMLFVGLGLLFVGMQTMTLAMKPLCQHEQFLSLLGQSNHPFVFVAVGAVMTALLQSSSAGIGILQTFVVAEALPLQSALFVLYGQNIGTCVTALLSSIPTNTIAKRAAIVHLLFNVIGSAFFVFVTLLCPFSDRLLQWFPNQARLQIAIAHVCFNLINTALLYPFTKHLVFLSEKMLPQKSIDHA